MFVVGEAELCHGGRGGAGRHPGRQTWDVAGTGRGRPRMIAWLQLRVPAKHVSTQQKSSSLTIHSMTFAATRFIDLEEQPSSCFQSPRTLIPACA